MIINVVGTSGAGKSHLVRWFLREGSAQLEGVTSQHAQYADGRKAPLGYGIFFKDDRRSIYVVGAYEAPSSGGCDTFGGDGRIERLYSHILELHHSGRDVIYEGVMMMNHTRGIELWNRTRALQVLRLVTPLEECIAAVRERRTAVGRLADFSTKNTEDTYRRTQNYCAKLRALGCPVHKVTRDEAPAKLIALLRESGERNGDVNR
jgi:hypothetical protein